MTRSPPNANAIASDSAFDDAMRLAVRLSKSEALRWVVTVNAHLVPRLRAPEVEAELPDKTRRDEFASVLAHDIATALEAIATGEDYEALLQRHLPPRKDNNKPWDSALLRARLERVRAELFTAILRERVLLRQTSKASGLGALEWQVGVKLRDSRNSALSPVNYATVAVEVLPPTAQRDNGLRALFGCDVEIQVFEFHEQDIALLIEDLSKVRDALRELTTAG